MDMAVLDRLREMEDEEAIVQSYSEEDELLAQTLVWLEELEDGGPRRGPLWYTPVQTEASAEESTRSLRGSSKAKARPARPGGVTPSGGAKEKAKKPTAASLSVALQEVMTVLPTLTSQLQLVTQRQQSLEEKMVSQGSISGMLSQPLGGPAAAVSTAALAKEIPKPPKVKPTSTLHLQPLASSPTELKEMEEIRGEAPVGGDVAKAMLAQSAALTSLVAHLTAGHQDPMQELQGGVTSGTRGALGRARLQTELASQKGVFYHAVLMQMARRMAPTSPSEQPYGTLMSSGISGVKYLERFGGYGRQRELGVVMYQVMVAFDFMMVENYTKQQRTA